MKDLWLWSLFCLTYLFGTTHAFFYRTMADNATTSVTNHTRKFNAFEHRIKERIEKDKIKKKICGIIRDVCKPKQVRANIIPVKAPTTATIPNSPTTTTIPNSPSPNFNISLIFSEPSEYSNETNCMQFRLPSDTSVGQIVTGADVFVYVTTRRNKSADRSRKRRRRRMRKISIKVSLLDEETKYKKVISRLRLRPTSNKKWYKLVLPFSVLRKTYHLKDKALNLCIDCKKCNSNTQIILPLKTSKKMRKYLLTRKQQGRLSSKNKNGKKLRLRKKRPFLMCHTSQKLFERRRRDISQCDINNRQSKCCLYQRYVRFSDMGLGDRVSYPDGYYETQCVGSCSTNNTTQALTQCVPRSYKPLQTLFVFDSDVMYLDIPQAQITDCSCQ